MVSEVVAISLWFWLTGWSLPKFLGAVILISSVTVMFVARAQLGGAFSAEARAVKLVKGGVYSCVRNPIYVAGCFQFLGVALLAESWLPLLIIPVLVPIQMRRADREAQILEAAFGAEYLQFRQATWF